MASSLGFEIHRLLGLQRFHQDTMPLWLPVSASRGRCALILTFYAPLRVETLPLSKSHLEYIAPWHNPQPCPSQGNTQCNGMIALPKGGNLTLESNASCSLSVCNLQSEQFVCIQSGSLNLATEIAHPRGRPGLRRHYILCQAPSAQRFEHHLHAWLCVLGHGVGANASSRSMCSSSSPRRSSNRSALRNRNLPKAKRRLERLERLERLKRLRARLAAHRDIFEVSHTHKLQIGNECKTLQNTRMLGNALRRQQRLEADHTLAAMPWKRSTASSKRVGPWPTVWRDAKKQNGMKLDVGDIGQASATSHIRRPLLGESVSCQVSVSRKQAA